MIQLDQVDGGIFFLNFRPGFMNEAGVRRGLHCSSLLLVVALVLPPPLARAQLDALVDAAARGIELLTDFQRQALAG